VRVLVIVGFRYILFFTSIAISRYIIWLIYIWIIYYSKLAVCYVGQSLFAFPFLVKCINYHLCHTNLPSIQLPLNKCCHTLFLSGWKHWDMNFNKIYDVISDTFTYVPDILRRAWRTTLPGKGCTTNEALREHPFNPWGRRK